YDLKEKPAFLKLEQLELNLGMTGHIAGKKLNYGRQTILQKILAEKSGQEKVEIGEVIDIEPDFTLSMTDVHSVVKYFQEKGFGYVWNPNRVALALDQFISSQLGETAISHKAVRDFSKKQNIKNLFDSREGICHQVIIEKGLILPGQLALATDNQIVSCGCIGAFALSINSSQMANLWVSGKTEIKVPETIKVIINGRLSRGVYARDVILFIGKNLVNEGIDNRVIEFYGSTASQMSISERFTLSHQATALGAGSAIFPFDSVVRRYLTGRTRMPYRPAFADKDVLYTKTFEFNVGQLTPQVLRSGSVSGIVPVAELEGLPIDQVVIGSCANGRFEDLRIAADILKGRKVHPDTRLLIYPSSREVYLETLKKGLIRAFVEAGAIVMNPGHEPYSDTGETILAPGERCLSTGGGNTPDVKRTGAEDIYFVSPATAAASAVKGIITDPTGYIK
ncbi:MAG: aconitase family protein, partial [candidate division Zixibacteria bacterium]|nr:aconitase family protein [candidate division Zixibacteria bacterium]